MKSELFVFLFVMWILIVMGGGILVLILDSIHVSEFGDLNLLVSSFIKVILAIILIVAWIFILSRIKNLIFTKEIKF